MTINPLFLAVRAISAEFAHRIYTPVIIITGIVFVVILAISIALVTMSAWWWLLLVPAIFFSLVFAFLAIVTGIAINFLRPAQTATQKRDVRSFVDSIQSSSEVIQTPKFILLFRLAKDVIAPSKTNFINELSVTVSSLQPRFKAIVASFK